MIPVVKKEMCMGERYVPMGTLYMQTVVNTHIMSIMREAFEVKVEKERKIRPRYNKEYLKKR